MPKPPLSMRDLIRKRAHNRCEKCGTKIVRRKNGLHNGSFHHRHMRRLGGLDTIYNLVLVCVDCHKDIHHREHEAALTGWVAWADPAVTPLRLASGGWVLLVPDGTFEYLAEDEALRLLEYVNGHAATDSPKALAIA